MKYTGGKPYYSFHQYIQETYGEKLYKISLDGGMTCPNRDGKIDTRGCIFCSTGGAGEFAGNREKTIREQIEDGKRLVANKFKGNHYIAYFQAFSNTYAPAPYLERIYREAMQDASIKLLSIATRPDCLDADVLNLLQALHAKDAKRTEDTIPITIELGLQTIHESSALWMRRGYPLSVFEECLHSLRALGIPVIVHVILGLPTETKDMMLETIDYLNKQDIQGIKLQLLHVLKNTDLATVYDNEPFPIMTEEEYIALVGDCLSRLRPDIVIHRLTGDGPKRLLIAPTFMKNKKHVLNSMQKYLNKLAIWQGKSYTIE